MDSLHIGGRQRNPVAPKPLKSIPINPRGSGDFFAVGLPPDTRFNRPAADPFGRRDGGERAALLAPGSVVSYPTYAAAHLPGTITAGSINENGDASDGAITIVAGKGNQHHDDYTGQNGANVTITGGQGQSGSAADQQSSSGISTLGDGKGPGGNGGDVIISGGNGGAAGGGDESHGYGGDVIINAGKAGVGGISYGNMDGAIRLNGQVVVNGVDLNALISGAEEAGDKTIHGNLTVDKDVTVGGGANVSEDQTPYIFPMSFIYILDIVNMSFLYTNPARPAPPDLLHPASLLFIEPAVCCRSIRQSSRGLPGPRAPHQGRRFSAANSSGPHDPGLRQKIQRPGPRGPEVQEQACVKGLSRHMLKDSAIPRSP